MPTRFGGTTWSVLLPENWRAWHDEACATIVGPENRSALQLSSYTNPNGDIVDADLEEFALQLGTEAVARPTTAGEFIGYEIAFKEDARFWRHWFLRKGNQLVLVTYNCAEEHRGVEDSQVDEVLATLVEERDDG